MKYRDLDAAQKKRLWITFVAYVAVGVLVMTYFCLQLYTDRQHAEDSWDSYLQDTPQQQMRVEALSADAARVTVGTYLENLREINMKSSYYRAEFMVWFCWEGDAGLDPAHNFRIYKGLENKRVLLQEIHDGDSHYQLVGMDVSVSKEFETKRFPLETHQMRFYVESNDPIQQVLFVPDYENSGLNRNLSIAGFDFLRYGIGAVSYNYESTHGNPLLTENETTSEIVTAFEINRSSAGLYFKCFVALAGTVTWVLIALFICTYHRIDPLGLIPGALFGTVSNIMIGANLLPDALEMGLMEYVNIWGILSILGGAIAIISINRVRKKSEDKDYAHFYGTVLFYTVLVFSVGGQVILPLMAYMR